MKKQITYKVSANWKSLLGVIITTLLGTQESIGDGGVTYKDIAANGGAGITYQRTKSANDAQLEAIKKNGPFDFTKITNRTSIPVKSRGAPGTALLDFDKDGDLDIYVTNGPGTPNSLYSNQLKEKGVVEFEDVGIVAGVDATDQDSTGVCFGDIDNDGDEDLLVLGYETGNRLFRNQADGTFDDITAISEVGGKGMHPSSCAMGDVNGDGLLDIALGNTFNNWDTRLPLMTYDHDNLVEPNQLLINQGGKFADESQSSGIQDSPARITWALSLVDYDLDGDLDLVAADDQGAKAPALYGGVDDGYVRIQRNDGTGHFLDVTNSIGTNRFGAWMGLSFGDFNGDSKMDIFATNTGYYITSFMQPVLNFPAKLGEWESGWFLAKQDGSMTFPGVGPIVATPFGWGTSASDYDNDGDTDILYYGGIDMGPFEDASNPGTILQNHGRAKFTYDSAALSSSTNHSRRGVHGMSMGDLNNDGYPDIVTVSSQDWPQPLPLVNPFKLTVNSPFDSLSYIWPLFSATDMSNPFASLAWNGIEPVNGTLSVELSSGGNGNNWAKITAMGSVGIVKGATVNRDGIGAVMTFIPEKGQPAVRPVLGGSSTASQDSLEGNFGLGKAKSGALEILWPGSRIRNKLYNVKASEHLLIPEIPCSYVDEALTLTKYKACVVGTLKELMHGGVLNKNESNRFFHSAIKAFTEYREDCDTVELIEADLLIQPPVTAIGPAHFLVGGKSATATATVTFLSPPNPQEEIIQPFVANINYDFGSGDVLFASAEGKFTPTQTPGVLSTDAQIQYLGGTGAYDSVSGNFDAHGVSTFNELSVKMQGMGHVCRPQHKKNKENFQKDSVY
ncbi:MAG: CRTAC1 family protein [Methylobacter sp.]|nr:CRTAC1 family protein [Methylobacter sp.]